MTQVKAAKTTILTSLMQSKVDQAYPNQSPAIKQGIARHLAQWTMQNTTTNIASLHTSANQAIAHAQQIPDLPERLAPLCSMTRQSAELGPHMEYIAGDLQSTCVDNRSKLDADGARSDFDAQGFYSVSLKDAHRDCPSISDVRVSGDSEKERIANFKNMTLVFAPNNDEREVLTTLLSQTSLFPVSTIWMNMPGAPTMGAPIPVNSKLGDYMPIMTQHGVEAPRYQMSRNENGDAVIHVNLGLATQATVDGIRYGNDNTFEGKNGVLHYDVVVPHAQFQAGLPHDVAPQMSVQNMRVVTFE